jgi:hypothetical protein
LALGFSPQLGLLFIIVFRVTLQILSGMRRGYLNATSQDETNRWSHLPIVDRQSIGEVRGMVQPEGMVPRCLVRCSYPDRRSSQFKVLFVLV